MTTRSGTTYKNDGRCTSNHGTIATSFNGGSQNSGTEECAKREQELQEERRRYEEALTKRDNDMQQQMDLLRGLVEGLRTSGEPLSVSVELK